MNEPPSRRTIPLESLAVVILMVQWVFSSSVLPRKSPSLETNFETTSILSSQIKALFTWDMTCWNRSCLQSGLHQDRGQIENLYWWMCGAQQWCSVLSACGWSPHIVQEQPSCSSTLKLLFGTLPSRTKPYPDKFDKSSLEISSKGVFSLRGKAGFIQMWGSGVDWMWRMSGDGV